jgi:hypothetical protein
MGRRMYFHQYTLLRFKKHEDAWKGYDCPFDEDKTYIYFGEIPNMPGHIIVAEYKTGKIMSGYHPEEFEELSEEET